MQGQTAVGTIFGPHGVQNRSVNKGFIIIAWREEGNTKEHDDDLPSGRMP